MFQDENNIYEIAYMMCNESIKKMLGDDLNVVIDKAVDDTVMMFSPKVKDCDALKKYLHVSFLLLHFVLFINKCFCYMFT